MMDVLCPHEMDGISMIQSMWFKLLTNSQLQLSHLAMQSALLCICAVQRSRVIASTYVYRLALASG